jgi:tetratricopeptide (TPR) repeat protein
LIRAHKVTHIAIVSEENFIAQYFQLLNPKGTIEQVKQCFGVRLYYDKVVPQWLQMIPYKLPDDLAQLKVSVMLFKVNFDQTLAEAVYNVAISQIESGNINDAEHTLDILLQKLPEAHQPWLRKGEVLLARRDWPAALECLLRGVSLAPAAERNMLYTTYAKPFYDARQYELAVRIYRAALADQKSADAACYLAWVLATVPQDSVRNGKEALELAQEAVKVDPNSPIYLNALAAALAENARFSEAAAVGDRALANSRLKADPPNVQQIFAERLATIKAGRPLRVEPAQ